MYEIQVVRDEKVVHTVDLAGRPIALGRGPSNDLVLSDPEVSWSHASIWADGAQLWLRDLGSTNGTWLASTRVTGTVPLEPDAVIGLGSQVRIRVTLREDHPSKVLALDDLSGGLRFALVSDRFLVGSGRDCDLRLPGGPERAATLLVHGGEEVWLGTDQGERALAIGEEFEVEGRRLRLIEALATHVPTSQATATRYAYRLEATLAGATGPEAVLVDLRTANTYTVDAGNRAVLLYLLARRADEDRRRGAPDTEVGWCSDDEIKTGVWGRGGDDNKLHVLIYRIRGEIKKAGFDPWFLEKRHRFVRARVAEVHLR